MEQTVFLLCLSVVMLIGSYLAGSIPLVMNLSEAKLQQVSVFGAGLLVGTALSVIIPEGIRALFDSVAPLPKHSHTTEESSSFDPEAVHHLNSVIGLSLVLGFVIMLLIDQIASAHTRDIEGGGGRPKSTATIGLVVHSAVDGVALGAAASTTHTSVEMIVFLAIMLHKNVGGLFIISSFRGEGFSTLPESISTMFGVLPIWKSPMVNAAPAAFGLVSFLMHEGLDRKKIKRHLAVFSLSAPILALFTFFCIGQEGKEKLSTLNATGIAMLFSAGTFLYVATVHVLPELTAKAGGSFRPKQLLALVAGTLLPLLLSSGHHH